MERTKSAFFRNSATYGAITGMALIITGVLFYIINLENQSIAQWINYAVIVGGIFIGTKNFRDKMNFGRITYGKSLGSGVLISLFASIIFAFYTFIFFKYIDPAALEKIYEITEQSMMKQGTMSDQQIEAAMEVTKKMMTPFSMSLFIILGFVFWGFLFSLIISIFVKKQGNPYDEAMREVKDENPI